MLLDTMMTNSMEEQIMNLLPETTARGIANGALIMAAIVVLYLLSRIIEKEISKRKQEETSEVLITLVHRTLLGNPKIRVKREKDGERRTFFMPKGEYEEGMKGVLCYRGRYGTDFRVIEEEEQRHTDAYYRYQGRKMV